MKSSAPIQTTLLSLEHAFYTRGKLHFTDLNLSLCRGEKVALLGRNGAGKTTLLELLGGHLALEDGLRWQADGLKTAYLTQHPNFPDGETVRELLERSRPLQALEAQLRALEHELDARPELLSVWDALHTQFENGGGYTWSARMAKALGVLELAGFESREAVSLSGGERTRLALVLTLLCEPDLMFLDEPTNHLDITMRLWLEDHLKNTSSAILFTSHDRALHDAVAQKSWWVEVGPAEVNRVLEYGGGYSKTVMQRTLERRTLEKRGRVTGFEENRLERSQIRQSKWGRRSSALQSRLERLNTVEAPLLERKLRMSLLGGNARAKLVMWGEHLSFGYGRVAEGERDGLIYPKTRQKADDSSVFEESTFDDMHPRQNLENVVLEPILQDVAFRVRLGDRIALIGPNGAGKTTLLKLIRGELHSSDPRAKLLFEGGANLAYLDQHYHGLHPKKSLLEFFEDRFSSARAVQMLGRYGFGADYWDRLPDQLSGGERARAGLALISGLRADVLLLDEPTNHLDVETLESLEDALLAYPGAVVVVTHDRRFADKVANRVWSLENAQLMERSSLKDKKILDPARALEDDPPLVIPPEPTPRERMKLLEDRLLELAHTLNERHFKTPLSGREEGRLRSESHHTRLRLLEQYSEVYGAEVIDVEVRQKPLWIRATRGDAGALIYAKGASDCPFLRWDGIELHWEGSGGLPWFRRTLLLGALQILLERWDCAAVWCRGVKLSRAGYEKLIFKRQNSSFAPPAND